MFYGGSNDGFFLSSDHAVQYILYYFRPAQIVAAMCRVIGKNEVLKIIAEEVR